MNLDIEPHVANPVDQIRNGRKFFSLHRYATVHKVLL